ncbi:MAG: hypothetical protein ACD_80C00004G0002 [uncultured bacterium (gcode 4)]|uniref:Uncharacterized protein n=1 Tax=uncultured bacterium (gcode 4) TaxID=1234023 RepID=K1X627_9BACT|nr:MAG: hypothetical protein ACD_80C00004G0002 [uncultured bacterium (gcode 4)]
MNIHFLHKKKRVDRKDSKLDINCNRFFTILNKMLISVDIVVNICLSKCANILFETIVLYIINPQRIIVFTADIKITGTFRRHFLRYFLWPSPSQSAYCFLELIIFGDAGLNNAELRCELVAFHLGGRSSHLPAKVLGLFLRVNYFRGCGTRTRGLLVPNQAL